MALYEMASGLSIASKCAQYGEGVLLIRLDMIERWARLLSATQHETYVGSASSLATRKDRPPMMLRKERLAARTARIS